MFTKTVVTSCVCLFLANAVSITTHTPKSFISSETHLTRVTDPYELAAAGYFVPSSDQQLEPNELLSKQSYPCLFRLGNAFYDFTPFKLA